MALKGIRVVEFAGLAPGPFAGLVLSDWGADVIRVDRPSPSSSDVLCRGKRSIAVDLKTPSGLDVLTKLISQADVLIDPFRPSVMEKIGLGPDVFLVEGGLNRQLVYARLVGYSPTGPYSMMAGHDINYLALSGVLSMLPGDDMKPAFPLNLLADFGGGGLMCALGIILALFEREKSGLGQVVKTDMVSGARYLASFPLIHSPHSEGLLFTPTQGLRPIGSSSQLTLRMKGTLDGGSPFYNVYTCSDGQWISVGCIEPAFFQVFVKRFLEALPQDFLHHHIGWVPTLDAQYNREEWPRMRRFFEDGFKIYDRDHWAAVFQGSDACVVPVLSPSEAATLASSSPGSESSPFPHPYLSRTPAKVTNWQSSLRPGTHNIEILREIGLSDDDIRQLTLVGALGIKASNLSTKL